MTASPEAETECGWRARALAAERTVAVLKRKVVELYNGEGSGIQRTVERARAREAETRRRQELTELRNAELVRHGARLEAEVAARTRDLQVILDNVVFGFLVVGRDGAIRDVFTRSCVDLLGHDRLAGASLGAALGFDATRCDDLALGLAQVFDDVLPSELLLDQLPHRATGRDGCSLQLDGRVIRSRDGVVDSVLITICDVTALEAAQRDSAHYRLLVQLLRQREAFVGFVADFHALASDARAAIVAGDPRASRRALHTMKGNAACFGLAAVAELAHAVEDAPAITVDGIDRIERALESFLAHNVDVLGVTSASDSATSISITTDDLVHLEHARARPDAIARWIKQIRRRPARMILGPLEALVPRLAERFAKHVDLVIEGGDLRIDAAVLGPVVRELGHVVRNAIEHGIEPADDRAGKATTARLSIKFAEDITDYQIEIEDDGRGVEVDRLVAKARELRLCSDLDLARWTYDQLLELVFIDGLSTAATTTDISGRGVGMSAICAAVGRAGGTIHVRSHPGQGTRIEIRVPRNPTAEPADDIAAL